MSLDYFSEGLDLVFKHEGKTITDNPKDPGGVTNCGVTIPLLTDYLGKEATRDHILTLTESQIGDIYHKMFWTPLGLDLLQYPFNIICFDCAVNQGMPTVHKRLREMGDKLTLTDAYAVLNTKTIPENIITFYHRAVARYFYLYKRNQKLSLFLSGWIETRAGSYLEYLK